jgi:acyl carrier protein
VKSWTKAGVVKRIEEFVSEAVCRDNISLEDDSMTAEDLCIDSLDTQDILFAIEAEYGFEFEEEKLIDISTVGEFKSYIFDILGI